MSLTLLKFAQPLLGDVREYRYIGKLKTTLLTDGRQRAWFWIGTHRAAMATYGEFASVLQLGVGTGIGLSLFRAPIDLRTRRITRLIDADLTALRKVSSPFATRKRADLFSLKLRFISKCDELEGRMLLFMVSAVVGALMNLAGLVKATLDAGTAVPEWMACVLLFVSVINFLFIIGWLEIIAHIHIGPIADELRGIRARKA